MIGRIRWEAPPCSRARTTSCCAGSGAARRWATAAPVLDALPARGRAARARLPAEEGAPARRGPGRVPRHRGAVGLLAANCPHRGAVAVLRPQRGVRAALLYHGWKFDVTGALRGHAERAGRSHLQGQGPRARLSLPRGQRRVWTYMGPRETPPPFPPFEINTLPAEQVYPPLMMLEECNWVQALEGDIDSSHIDFVHAKRHARLASSAARAHRDKRPGSRCCRPTTARATRRRRRSDVEGPYWHRITQFILPFYIDDRRQRSPHRLGARLGAARRPLQPPVRDARAPRSPGDRGGARRRVDPFAGLGRLRRVGTAIRARATTPRPTSTTTTGWTASWQKELMLGIPFLGNLQDRAMTETMGPIYDRTQEHLGTTDAMVIFVRRRLSRPRARCASQGVVPANVDDPNALPGAAGLRGPLPDGESWIARRRRRASRTPACRSRGCRSSDPRRAERWADIRRGGPRLAGRAAGGRRPGAGDGRGAGGRATSSLAHRARCSSPPRRSAIPGSRARSSTSCDTTRRARSASSSTSR